MEDAGIINSARAFLDKLRDPKIEEVTIKFKKKNGSIRLMKCTLNFAKIPLDKRPRDVNLPKILKLMNDNGILHVYDLEKKDWRSVPFLKTEWMEIDNKQRYRIRIK